MNYEVLGIDLGTSKMALATARYVKPHEPRVVTTPGGMKSVPPSVGFRGKSRFVGEAASMQSRSNATNTVEDVAYHLGSSEAQAPHDTTSVNQFRRWTLHREGTVPAAKVEYNGATQSFDLRAITAMLFTQARAFQHEARTREGGEATKKGESCCVALAVPDSYTPEQVVAVCDAARLAELEVVAVATTSECLVSSFASGRSSNDAEGKEGKASAASTEEVVVFVDIGHTCTSVSVATFPSSSSSFNIASTASSSSLGGRNVDTVLYNHVTATLKEKGHVVEPRTKPGASVLRECAKAKKILSSNRETQVFMEQYVGKPRLCCTGWILGSW